MRILGTSGSTIYLEGTDDRRRYWPVTVPSVVSIDDRSTESCDGLHDEGAPVQYLCSWCFSAEGRLGDLAEFVDDEDQRDVDPDQE